MHNGNITTTREIVLVYHPQSVFYLIATISERNVLWTEIFLPYLLPVGPLRCDVALNPDPQVGEEKWTVHFSLGMSF